MTVFKMRVTRRRKSTCFSLTRSPRWLFLECICIHLLTLAPLFTLSCLEGVHTHQVFPVTRDASPLYDWNNAQCLLPSLSEPNNMFLTQFSKSKPACQGFHMFHCKGLLIRVYPSPQYWETRPQEIPSEHEHITPIQQHD